MVVVVVLVVAVVVDGPVVTGVDATGSEVAGSGWTTSCGGGVTTVTVACGDAPPEAGGGMANGVVLPVGPGPLCRVTPPGRTIGAPPPAIMTRPNTTAAPVLAAVHNAHRSRSGTRLRRPSERAMPARRSAFPPRRLPITTILSQSQLSC